MKNKCKASLSVLSSLLYFSSGLSNAVTLDMTFKANIVETTCEMKIEGGSGTASDYTIPVGQNGKTRLDYVIAGSDLAASEFKLTIVDCPDSLSSIKTQITGNASGYVKAGLVNSIAVADGGADYTAVTIARKTAPTSPFVVGSTDTSSMLVWTTDEIKTQKNVELIARLVETSAGKATTGTFSSTATFNFTYE